jgi:hypothetical protein
MTETGSHARILEPLLETPLLETPVAPSPVAEPSRLRRRDARPKVDRPAARSAARAARAATAAPAAKLAVRDAVAAKASAAPTVVRPPAPAVANPASLRPAAARRLQVAEKVGDTTPSLTENESWVVLVLLGAAAVATARWAPDLPVVLRYVGAAAVSCGLAWGLAVRTGGRPVWATVLTGGLAAGALITQWSSLLSGAAIGTGVLAATLAVMVTRPAATYLLAIKEALIATAVAAIGGLGVIGYGNSDTLNVGRFGYIVFGLSLLGAFALVYRLGAGLHGLGRRGYVVAGGAVVLLFLGMAYTEAISHWGSRGLVDSLDGFRDSTRSALGAVPHPIMALLGYPALVWGVFMRARRRQGWWVCAFGVAATAPSASRLVAADLGAKSIALGLLYSLVIGLAVGFLLIRGEQRFTGSHGSRARKDEESEAHRPEPRRTRPLH